MKSLLDASAFLLLIKNLPAEQVARHLKETQIIDLTYYEVGNGLWKERSLMKLTTPQQCEAYVNVAKAVLSEIETIACVSEAFGAILKTAIEEKLSFYDSSYLYFAKDRKLKLITEDKELFKKARKHVEVQTVAELLQA
jgi:predicted nucleic acid-binding protein